MKYIVKFFKWVYQTYLCIHDYEMQHEWRGYPSISGIKCLKCGKEIKV